MNFSLGAIISLSGFILLIICLPLLFGALWEDLSDNYKESNKLLIVIICLIFSGITLLILGTKL